MRFCVNKWGYRNFLGLVIGFIYSKECALAISCKVKKAFVPVTGRRLHYHRYTTSYNVRALRRYTFPLTAEQPASPTARGFQSATQE